MAEPDIIQHIRAASRGSLGDLNSVLNDFNARAIPEATAAQFRTGAESVTVTPSVYYAAQAPVVLVDAAPVVVDMAAGNVFTLAFTVARTISNPINPIIGQTGEFWVTNVNGLVELTWSANYKFVGTPTTGQTAGNLSCVRYRVISATVINCTMIKA